MTDFLMTLFGVRRANVSRYRMTPEERELMRQAAERAKRELQAQGLRENELDAQRQIAEHTRTAA